MSLTDSIIDLVSIELGVTRAQLLAPTRSSQGVAWARHVAVHLCHRLEPWMSWIELGRRFGRDRTTVRYAHERISYARLHCDELDAQLRRIEHAAPTI